MGVADRFWPIRTSSAVPSDQKSESRRRPVGTLLTTADNYVVEITRALDDPLRSLVVAAALGVDTALKQDARGLDFTDLIDGPF